MGLDDIIAKVNKQYKQQLAVKGVGDFVIKRIPFTSPRLNYETYGGIPRGRISMFVGAESSGKTTTSLDSIKNAQKLFEKEWAEELVQLQEKLEQPKLTKTEKSELDERIKYLNKRGPLKIVYFDAEGTIDADWCSKLGVDINNVYIFRLHQQTAEQFLQQVLDVADSDDVGLIVIDSIAGLVPQQIYEESLEKKNMGGNASVITMFVNKVIPKLCEHNITCIIINQIRGDFTNPYAEFSIPGGHALKHHCSLILAFKKGAFIDESGEEQKKSYETPQGNIVLVHVNKTKVFKPDRRVGFYTLSYDHGIDVVLDLFDVAVTYDIIAKAGSWFTIINPDTKEALLDGDGEMIKFQGKANMISFLRENPEVFEFIYDYINSRVSNKDSVNLKIDESGEELARLSGDIPEVDQIPVRS